MLEPAAEVFGRLRAPGRVKRSARRCVQRHIM
jgi:hypothetical protein